MAASSDFQCEIGCPYFFSIDGKYEAGPVTFSALIVGTVTASPAGRQPIELCDATERRHTTVGVGTQAA